jgi:hypothetical protein
MATKNMSLAARLVLVASLAGLGVGCKAHASATTRAGSDFDHDRDRAHGDRSESHARKPASGSSALRDGSDAKEADAPTAVPPSKDTPKGEASSVAADGAPAADHDRGHGNDADGVDEDNPGKSKKKPTAAKKAAGDHDRGHGNDSDGVDEDNPGKSKKAD